MLQTMSLPLARSVLSEYRDFDQLREELLALDLQGIEAVGAMEPIPEDFPRDLVQGYHLLFYPDWLDMWREDTAALTKKFGSLDTATRFYGGFGREHLLNLYRQDLRDALSLHPRYLVYHVSDVSIEEGYTYRWLHRDQDVIDAAADLINEVLGDRDLGVSLLMENQWWPGLTLLDNDMTARLLERVRYPRKGLLLDTGHMMNCCTALSTEREAAHYIQKAVESCGTLGQYIEGVHLHVSLSGDYVRSHTGTVPEHLPEDYWKRFAESYSHILRIDPHRPWTDPVVRELVELLSPAYLTHELTGRDRQSRYRAIRSQRQLLSHKQ